MKIIKINLLSSVKSIVCQCFPVFSRRRWKTEKLLKIKSLPGLSKILKKNWQKNLLKSRVCQLSKFSPPTGEYLPLENRGQYTPIG